MERNSLKRPGHGLDPFRLPGGKKVPLNHKFGERYNLTESVQTPQIWKSASPSRSHSPESTILMCVEAENQSGPAIPRKTVLNLDVTLKLS